MNHNLKLILFFQKTKKLMEQRNNETTTTSLFRWILVFDRASKHEFFLKERGKYFKIKKLAKTLKRFV